MQTIVGYSVCKYAELFWDQNFIVQVWRLVAKPNYKQFQERTLSIALCSVMIHDFWIQYSMHIALKHCLCSKD